MHARVHSFTTKLALLRPLSAHGAHTRLVSITKLPSGNRRTHVRRKGRYIAETFRRHRDAEEWALAMERQVDRSETPSTRAKEQRKRTSHGGRKRSSGAARGRSRLEG